MADETVSVGVTADNKSFIRAFNESAAAVKTLINAGKAMQSAFSTAVGHVVEDLQKIKSAATKVALGVGTGFASSAFLIHKSLGNFKDFETAMANVNTVAGDSTATLGHMSNAVMNLTGQFPQTAEELAAGLYEVNSAGFQADDALRVLKDTAQFSSAGLVDMATSVRGTASILNAYSLKAGDAAHVTDVMFKAVEVGQMNATEFANQIGDWASSAAALQIPFETAAAAMAVLTTKGALLAPQAATSLAAIFRGIISPSDEMGKAIKRAGFESGKSMLQHLGLAKTLGTLWEATGKNETTFHKLFLDQEGFKGALSLTNAGYEMLIKTQDQFNDRTQTNGTTAAAFAKQMDTLSAHGKIFANETRRMGYEIGQLVAPIANFTLSGTTNMLKFFNDMPGPIRKAVAVMQLMSPVLIASGTVIGAWIIKGLLWKKAMTAIATTDFVKVTAESGRLQKALGAALNSEKVKTFFLEVGRAGGPLGFIIEKIKAFALANMELKAAMLGTMGTAVLYTAAFAAVAVMVASAVGAFSESAAKAKAVKETFVQASSGALTSMKQLNDENQRAIADWHKADSQTGKGFWGKLGVDIIATGQALTPWTDNTKLHAMDAKGALLDLNKEYTSLTDVVTHFAQVGGLSNDQVLGSLSQLAAEGKVNVQDLMKTYQDLITLQQNQGVADFVAAKASGGGTRGRGAWGKPKPDPRDFMTPEQANEFNRLNGVMEATQKEIDALNRKMTAMEAISHLTSASAAEFAAALFTVGDEASTAADKLGAYGVIIDQLLGNNNAILDAQSSFIQSIETAGQAMVDNGPNFDLTTAKGQALQEGLSKAASATSQLATETIKQSGVASDAVPIVTAYAEGLIAVAQQAGFSNSQVATMVETMGLTPEMIQTLVTLPGIDPAIAQLLTTSGLLQGLNGFVANATVAVTVQVSAAQSETDRETRRLGGTANPLSSAGSPASIQDAIDKLIGGIKANIPKTAGKKGGGGGGGGGGGTPKWQPTAEQLANMQAALAAPITALLQGDLGAAWQKQMVDAWMVSTTKNMLAEGKTRLGAGILKAAQTAGTDPAQEIEKAATAYAKLVKLVGQGNADIAAGMTDNLDQFTAYVDTVEALIKHQQDVEDWKASNNLIDNMAYYNILVARRDAFAQFSDEWMQITDQINTVTQQMSDANIAAFNEEKRLEQAKFDLGEESKADYLKFLRDRLQYYEKYSQEWMTIWNEIKNLEQQVIDDQKAATDKVNSFADSVKKAFDDIKKSVEDPIVRATSLIAAFGDQATVTQGQIQGFYSHMLEGTQRWVTVIKALKEEGINKDFLNELIQAGPKSLSFAEQVLALGTGGVNMINSSMAEIANLAGGLGTNIAQGSIGTLNQNDQSITIDVGGVSIVGEMPGGVTLEQVAATITNALNGVAVQIGSRQRAGAHP